MSAQLTCRPPAQCDGDVGPLAVNGCPGASQGTLNRADTIRYYERAGLLPVPQRTEGEHRRYGRADVDRLLFIRGAQRLGLRLAEIRDLLTVRDTGDCACEPAADLLQQHVTQIDTEIQRLSALRSELLTMLAAMPGPSCPDPCDGSCCYGECC